MNYSDTTNKDGIIQQIEVVTGLGLTAISGDAELLAYFTNLINIWLHTTSHWIQQSQGEWAYDDDNHDNFPIETFLLNSDDDDDQDFELSTEGEKSSFIIKRVEMQNVEDDLWYDLNFCYQKDIIEDWTGQIKGKPSKYWLNGSSILFDRPVDITLVDYYRLTYDRNAHLFVVGDEAAEPGFDIKFHSILIYGPAMEYCLRINKPEVVTLCRAMLFGTDARRDKGLKEMLQRFYGDRVKAIYKPKSRYIGYR